MVPCHAGRARGRPPRAGCVAAAAATREGEAGGDGDALAGPLFPSQVTFSGLQVTFLLSATGLINGLCKIRPKLHAESFACLQTCATCRSTRD